MKNADFCEFVEKYEKLVYTVCMQFTANHHTAQDLAQDTFISAYTHWESCPEDNPKAWVCRIAANKAKDYLKSAYRRRVQPAGQDEEMAAAGQMLYMQQTLPENEADRREVREGVAAAVEGLKEPYRSVAQLNLISGYSVKEIAGGLEKPPKTVQTQLYRARMQLRQSLSPLCTAN